MKEQYHALWIGNQLSETELLTLLSFAKFEQTITLWAYQTIKNLPNDVILRDANEIIPENEVFSYTNSKIDFGNGSYAGFSDVFRYKLLYEHGGWWIDMDMTCLKKFNFKDEYFFRNHWKLDVVGNLMKCPPKSELMKQCYERAVIEVKQDNTDWHKPIVILNEEIIKLDLMKHRHCGLVNLDMAHTLNPYVRNKFNLPIPKDWIVIHWLNSIHMKFKKHSTFYSFLKEYGLK